MSINYAAVGALRAAAEAVAAEAVAAAEALAAASTAVMRTASCCNFRLSHQLIKFMASACILNSNKM